MSVLGRLQQSLVPSNFQAAAAVRLGGGDGDGLDVPWKCWGSKVRINGSYNPNVLNILTMYN